MTRNIPEETRQEIIQFYTGGHTLLETARNFQIKDMTVSAILHNAGVVRKRGSWTENPLSEAEKRKIIDLYREGLSATKIATALGRRISTVSGYIKDQGIFRDHGSWMIGNRPASAIQWDEGFFKRDCPVTAYWAGFIFADGSIGDGTSKILTVTSTDIEHMYKFANDIRFLGNVRVSEPSGGSKLPYATIRVSGMHLVDDTRRWGSIPNKTYNFVTPDIPNSLIPHYIRGWFDGDGYFRERHNKEAFRITTCVGAEEWCAEQLRLLGYTGHIGFERKDGQAWSKIVISGRKNISWVFNAISGYPRLERKWSKIDAFLESIHDAL